MPRPGQQGVANDQWIWPSSVPMRTMAVSLALSSSLSFLNSVRSSSLSSSTVLTANFGSTNAQFLKMEAKAKTRREDRTARHERIRKKVHGTPERPRLCVFRSNKHLCAQVIDDTKMHTLASASTMHKSLAEEIQYTSGPTIEVAKRVGEAIAKVCLEKGISKVAFDRGGYLYHGRVKALADSAREHGLDF